MARAQTDSFITLSTAWWEFAPDALKAAYRDFERRSAIERFLRGNVDLSQLISSPFGDSPDIFNVNPNIKSMQKYIVDELLGRSLEARGLRTYRSNLQKTEAIPGQYFENAKIDWRENTVVKFGIRFELVEVRRVNIVEQVCVEAVAVAAEPLVKLPKKARKTLEGRGDNCCHSTSGRAGR